MSPSDKRHVFVDIIVSVKKLNAVVIFVYIIFIKL